MSDWLVQYTNRSVADLESVYEYIAFELQEPAIAQNQVSRIMNSIDSLDQMPFRYRLYDREPWYSKGLRVIAVDNYVVFYLPNEETKTVSIVRIMYGGRNIEAEL